MDSSAQEKRTPFLPLLLVFILGAALYLPKVSDNIGWYNSGEFVAAAITADVVHAPGYPLFSRMNEAFLAMPFAAGPAYKLNLLSALIAVAAATMLMFLLLKAGIRVWPAITGTVLLLASRTYFDQAILVEVYCLEVLFIIFGLLVGMRLSDDDSSKGLAFAAGLSGAIGVGHRPTFVLYSLALLFFVNKRSKSLKEMSLLWFALGIGVGLIPSLDLYFRLQNPQRLLLDPMVGQGFFGFLRVFSGTVYSGGLFSLDIAEVWQRLLFFFKFIFTDASVLVLPAALLALFSKSGPLPLKKALVLIGMVNLLFVLNYNAFEAHSMLLPCLFALSALSAFTFNAVNNCRLRLAICLLVILSTLTGAWFRQEPTDGAAVAYSQRMLSYVPDKSVMLMSNDVEFRPYYYLRLTTNLRQDIAVQLVDDLSPQELRELERISSFRPVVGTLIHPADSLQSLVASFSMACEGYGYRILPPLQPLQNDKTGESAVVFGQSEIALKLEEAEKKYAPGEAIAYQLAFSGAKDDFSRLRVWAFLTDANNRVITRNGLLVGHDCHYPLSMVNRACLQQENADLTLKRSLIIPVDLPTGSYRLNFFFEKMGADEKQVDFNAQPENQNLFNLEGYLEVFRLNYGLTQRLTVPGQTAQKIVEKLPQGFVGHSPAMHSLEIR